MDVVELTSLISQLDDHIDDLEDALTPLLKAALSDAAGKLPLLDRAKLYVLATYAVESLLFCWFSHLVGLERCLQLFHSVHKTEWSQR